MLAASLPLAGLALILLAVRTRSGDGRAALLHSATIWGVLVVLITETLSLVGGITPAGLGAAWLVLDVIALALVWRAMAIGECAHAGPGLRTLVRRIDVWDLALLGGVAVIVAIVGTVALLSPPNTWDVMQYHLPRIVHWLQNRRVAFYPTHELKQLHMPPGAEYVMLQLHALWGGDRLDNLVQWLAFLGCIVGVTVLARALGAGPRGQVLAAVVCATIPEGILMGSGSKNDYVLSFWLVALVYYAMRFQRDPGRLHGAGLGAALGLAWLTKGTGYVLGAPLLATLWLFWPWKVKVALVKGLPLIIALAVGLNGGHFVRNYAFYGSPFGPQAEDSSGQFKYTNDVISITTTLSNIVRNTVLHVRSAHRADNAVIEHWTVRTLRWIGADPDDPRTNFFSLAPFQLPEVQVHEGLAGNPAHLALLFGTLLVLAVSGYRPERRAVAVYALGLILSYAAFCAVLKWQPLHARLHLPLFVLWSPAIGVVIGAWPAPAMRGAAVVLLLLALPMATRNDVRPVFARRQASVFVADRAAQYFGDRRELERTYRAAVDFVQKTACRHVGLDLSAKTGAQYEYPLLALLGAGTETEVRTIAIANASAGYAGRQGTFRPCAVICVLCDRAGRQWERYEGRAATPAVFGDIVVFTPDRHHAPRWSLQDLRVTAAESADAGTPDSALPAVRIRLDRVRFRPGERVTIGLDARNPVAGTTAELYVSIELPDGGSAVFVGPAGLGNPISLADARAYPRAAVAAPGFALSTPVFAEWPLPVGVAQGRYRILAFMLKGHVPRGPRIAPEDFLAWAVRDIIVSP